MASPGPDMGYAVIILTIAIRVLLLPISFRGARSEHRLMQLEPIIAQIKKRYQYDLEKQREAIRKLLKDNDIGVMSNFFSLIFQIFFLVILYKIFASGLQLVGHNQLYHWMPQPGVIDPYFIQRINLIVPNSHLSIFAAFVVFLQQVSKRMTRISEATSLEKIMLVALPAFTYVVTILLPASKPLFIATTVIFSMVLSGITQLIVKLFVKDEKLKANMDALWTS